MTQQYNAGDEVQLRSGGPIMTVVDFADYGHGSTKMKYLCRWFDDKHQLQENTFTEPELRIVPQRTPTRSMRGI